jgi:hypothetical protein
VSIAAKHYSHRPFGNTYNFQPVDRSTAFRRFTQQPKLPSVELKMLAPRILARVEKGSLPVRFRIDAENVIGLPGITRVAAKC